MASCDLVEGVHQGRQEAADQRQGVDSSCSDAAGGLSYYVVEVAPSVQAEGLLRFEVEVGHHVQVGVLVPVGCSCYEGGFVQG